MTLEQKVGQMFLLAFAGSDPTRAEGMIREHFIGGCYISQDNAQTPRAACALSSRLQGYATSCGPGIPSSWERIRKAPGASWCRTAPRGRETSASVRLILRD